MDKKRIEEIKKVWNTFKNNSFGRVIFELIAEVERLQKIERKYENIK